MQLQGSGIALMKLGAAGVPSLVEWAGKTLKRGQILGVDPQVMSMAAADDLERALGEKGIEVRYVPRNLVDRLWTDRPAPSEAPVRLHGPQYAGEKALSKLARVRAAMKYLDVDAHVLSALDAIAWLCNIRSRDIESTPVVISYLVVTGREAVLYLDESKLNDAVRRGLKGIVKIRPYAAVAADLRALGRRRAAGRAQAARTRRSRDHEPLGRRPARPGPADPDRDAGHGTAGRSRTRCRSAASPPPTSATARRW